MSLLRRIARKLAGQHEQPFKVGDHVVTAGDETVGVITAISGPPEDAPELPDVVLYHVNWGVFPPDSPHAGWLCEDMHDAEELTRVQVNNWRWDGKRKAVNTYYKIPADREKQFYDFYAAEQLAFLVRQNASMHESPTAAFRQLDEGSSDLASAQEAVETITTHLQAELLRNIFQACAGELRHFNGRVSSPALQAFYADLAARSRREQTGLKPGKDRLQQSGEFPAGSSSHSDAVASAAKITKNLGRSAFMAEAAKIFSQPGWQSSYGGKPWSDIAAAWGRLDSATKQQELFVAIDHVLDLEHNNNTFFDKIPTYQKDGGFGWVKEMLDDKYEATLPGILKQCSSDMRSIVQRIARRLNPNLLRDPRKDRLPEANPNTNRKVGDIVHFKGAECKITKIPGREGDFDVLVLKSSVSAGVYEGETTSVMATEIYDKVPAGNLNVLQSGHQLEVGDVVKVLSGLHVDKLGEVKKVPTTPKTTYLIQLQGDEGTLAYGGSNLQLVSKGSPPKPGEVLFRKGDVVQYSYKGLELDPAPSWSASVLDAKTDDPHHTGNPAQWLKLGRPANAPTWYAAEDFTLVSQPVGAGGFKLGDQVLVSVGEAEPLCGLITDFAPDLETGVLNQARVVFPPGTKSGSTVTTPDGQTTSYGWYTFDQLSKPSAKLKGGTKVHVHGLDGTIVNWSEAKQAYYVEFPDGDEYIKAADLDITDPQPDLSGLPPFKIGDLVKVVAGSHYLNLQGSVTELKGTLPSSVHTVGVSLGTIGERWFKPSELKLVGLTPPDLSGLDPGGTFKIGDTVQVIDNNQHYKGQIGVIASPDLAGTWKVTILGHTTVQFSPKSLKLLDKNALIPPPFQIGDTVRVTEPNENEPTEHGEVTELDPHSNSVFVEFSQGEKAWYASTDLKLVQKKQATTTLNRMTLERKAQTAKQKAGEQSAVQGSQVPAAEYKMKFFVEADYEGSTRNPVYWAMEIARAIRDYGSGDPQAAYDNVITKAKLTGLAPGEEDAVQALLLRWSVPVKVTNPKLSGQGTAGDDTNQIDFPQHQRQAVGFPGGPIAHRLAAKRQAQESAAAFLQAAARYAAKRDVFKRHYAEKALDSRLTRLLKAGYTRQELAAEIPSWQFPQDMKRHAISQILPPKVTLAGPRLVLSNSRAATRENRRNESLARIAKAADQAGLTPEQQLRLSALKTQFGCVTPFWIRKAQNYDSINAPLSKPKTGINAPLTGPSTFGASPSSTFGVDLSEGTPYVVFRRADGGPIADNGASFKEASSDITVAKPKALEIVKALGMTVTIPQVPIGQVAVLHIEESDWPKFLKLATPVVEHGGYKIVARSSLICTAPVQVRIAQWAGPKERLDPSVSCDRLEAEGYRKTGEADGQTTFESPDGSHVIKVSPSTISVQGVKDPKQSYAFGPQQLSSFLASVPSFGAKGADGPKVVHTDAGDRNLDEIPEQAPQEKVRPVIMQLITEGKTDPEIMAALRERFPHRKPVNMRGQLWLERNKSRYQKPKSAEPESRDATVLARLPDGRILQATITPTGHAATLVLASVYFDRARKASDSTEEAWNRCAEQLAGRREATDRVTRPYDHETQEPGEITCDCGCKLSLDGPGQDAECDKCGAAYNSAGQKLADRSQWGEETGETAADYDRGLASPERAFDED